MRGEADRRPPRQTRRSGYETASVDSATKRVLSAVLTCISTDFLPPDLAASIAAVTSDGFDTGCRRPAG